MPTFNVTDVNTGATLPVDSANVNAIYDLTDYRIIRFTGGVEYDVTETFASLCQDVGQGGGGNP